MGNLRPWVVLADDILHAFAVHDDVVNELDTFSQPNDVEVVGEEVQVGDRLIQWIRRCELDISVLRERAHQVDEDRQPVALGRCREMPLERVAEHWLCRY